MDNIKISLKTAREMKGLTQSEAAKQIGISEDSLSNYERGKTYPNVPVIRKIEKVYGLSYDQLFFLPLDNGLTVKSGPSEPK
jgi:putative transcriptional regulator